jgi:Holliday junction resolvase RusA-like endonuclease
MNIQDDLETLLKDTSVTKDKVREEMVRLFNLLNSRNIDYKTISIGEEEEIVKWLNKNDVSFITARRKTYLQRDWFVNEADKHSWLSQFHCKVCGLEGISVFPIRIPPKSRQTKTELKNRFQELISQAPFAQNKRFNSSDRICLKLVFIINQSRDKDLDNMAKTTLDGLKKVLLADDKQIDHLELIKFKANYIEEFISVSIGRSNLNNQNNIIFKGVNLGFAGLEKMEI